MAGIIRAILVVVGLLAIVMLSIDNRELVGFSLWPLPYAYQVPLYWIMLVALATGIVLGGLAAWISGAATRAERRRLRNKVSMMEQQERVKREADERAQVEEARRKTRALTLSGPARAREPLPALQ
jgi:uncharacterized integral membrane protein